jgi:UDP-glucose 4-epimerase
MTRVLVTGATTPVGRALFDLLSADDRVERVLAVLPPGLPPFEPVHETERVGWVTADLTRERDVRSLLFRSANRDRTDVVVHLAAHRSARDRGRRIRALNVDSTRLLLDLAERLPTIRRFVLRSYSDVYRIRPEEPTILLEDHPLEFSRRAPQWVRNRVESDLTACTRTGTCRIEIAVVRGAECFGPNNGSQLWDYVSSNVCFTPLGFDPMINVVSVQDLADAMHRAVFASDQGAFNAPGLETFPLSLAVARSGRIRIPAPGPLLAPLYGLRALTRRRDFRYDQNYFRFHFGGVMDGRRAEALLGYVPKTPVSWPLPY